MKKNNRQPKSLTPLFLSFAILMMLLLAGCSTGLSTQTEASESSKTMELGHGIPLTDFSDKRRLVGWVDVVFIGTVTKNLGVHQPYSVPQTQFSVEVVASLKGELAELSTLTLDQKGGYSEEYKATFLMDSDPILEVGNTYLFSAKYNPDLDSYSHVPNFGDVLITDSNQGQLIKDFEDAIANQIPFEYPKESMGEN